LTRSATRGTIVRVIPHHARLLFWDIDLETFDPHAYPRYTIERVLEYGDEEDVAWMGHTFGREQILDVLRTDRHLTRLSANFWALYFGVPAADVAALQDGLTRGIGTGGSGEPGPSIG
jgi:hypothetical protein